MVKEFASLAIQLVSAQFESCYHRRLKNAIRFQIPFLPHRDGIVLFKDSVTLAEKLMLLGKDFDFVPLPSSVHNAMRRDYIAALVLRKITQHFERHLGKGPR